MDAKLFAALSPLFASRVYPVNLPEGATYPACRYQYVGNTEEPFVDAGQLIERFRVQIDIYTKDYDQCSALRRQCIEALRGLNEFMEQNLDSNGYEPDTQLFTWLIDMSFRNQQ